jgi:hypothetical protein
MPCHERFISPIENINDDNMHTEVVVRQLLRKVIRIQYFGYASRLVYIPTIIVRGIECIKGSGNNDSMVRCTIAGGAGS